MQSLSRSSEVQFFCNRHKVAQMPKFDHPKISTLIQLSEAIRSDGVSEQGTI